MTGDEDPEERIRELERPLAEAARASEVGSSAPEAYPAGPTAPPPPTPWTYGGPLPGPPPRRPSGNRMWWILGAVVAVGAVALAGGIAALAAHQLSGARSIITSPPTISGTSSPAGVPGARLGVAGVNQHRTIACNRNVVDVSGVSNTVVITGHCAGLNVSGVQNSVTVEAVDGIDASGFNNKITYHSGTPKVSNSGGSNVIVQG